MLTLDAVVAGLRDGFSEAVQYRVPVDRRCFPLGFIFYFEKLVARLKSQLVTEPTAIAAILEPFCVNQEKQTEEQALSMLRCAFPDVQPVQKQRVCGEYLSIAERKKFQQSYTALGVFLPGIPADVETPEQLCQLLHETLFGDAIEPNFVMDQIITRPNDFLFPEHLKGFMFTWLQKDIISPYAALYKVQFNYLQEFCDFLVYNEKKTLLEKQSTELGRGIPKIFPVAENMKIGLQGVKRLNGIIQHFSSTQAIPADSFFDLLYDKNDETPLPRQMVNDWTRLMCPCFGLPISHEADALEAEAEKIRKEYAPEIEKARAERTATEEGQPAYQEADKVFSELLEKRAHKILKAQFNYCCQRLLEIGEELKLPSAVMATLFLLIPQHLFNATLGIAQDISKLVPQEFRRECDLGSPPYKDPDTPLNKYLTQTEILKESVNEVVVSVLLRTRTFVLSRYRANVQPIFSLSFEVRISQRQAKIHTHHEGAESAVTIAEGIEIGISALIDPCAPLGKEILDSLGFKLEQGKYLAELQSGLAQEKLLGTYYFFEYDARTAELQGRPSQNGILSQSPAGSSSGGGPSAALEP